MLPPRAVANVNVGIVELEDLETGELAAFDTGSRWVREGWGEVAEERAETRDRLFRKAKAEPLLLEIESQGLRQAAGGGIEPLRERVGPGPAVGIHPQGAQQQGAIAQGQPAPGLIEGGQPGGGQVAQGVEGSVGLGVDPAYPHATFLPSQHV